MREGGFIAGIGAANVDFHGASRAPLILRDSNPGTARITAGGVTRNVLENLARMGESVRLFTAIGDDLLGRFLLEQCARVGIDTRETLCCAGVSSSCYMALLDSSGDMFAALSDMSILQHITPDWLSGKLPLLRRARAVTCDPCLSPETLEWIVSGVLDNVPLYADPVSTTYAKRLRPFARGFFCLKPNLMELEALTGCDVSRPLGMELAADRLLEQGTERVVVSLGRRGCYWADRQGERFTRALRPVERMADATGAGDAFMAGLIHSGQQTADKKKMADIALAAGAMAVTGAGTVSSEMSEQRLRKVLEDYQ